MAPSTSPPESDKPPWDAEALQAILDRCAALPEFDTPSEDEILRYEENRIPT